MVALLEQDDKINHRDYICPRHLYDVLGHNGFDVLVKHGLREYHTLFDLGCNGMKAGRLLMMYLNKNRYFASDANRLPVVDALKSEIGDSLLKIKKPHFYFSESGYASKYHNVSFDYLLVQSLFVNFNETILKLNLAELSRMMDIKTQLFCVFKTVLLEKLIDIFGQFNLELAVLDDKHPCNYTWIKAVKKSSE